MLGGLVECESWLIWCSVAHLAVLVGWWPPLVLGMAVM